MIDPTAYVCPFSTIIGDVTIRKNVFIAPNVSIRADEGYPFYIDSDTNLQDGVILHGSDYEGRVIYGGREYSIYIGKHVSIAQGSIIYGPCEIGVTIHIWGFIRPWLTRSFQRDVIFPPYVLVTGGIKVAPNRFVPAGTIR